MSLESTEAAVEEGVHATTHAATTNVGPPTIGQRTPRRLDANTPPGRGGRPTPPPQPGRSNRLGPTRHRSTPARGVAGLSYRVRTVKAGHHQSETAGRHRRRHHTSGAARQTRAAGAGIAVSPTGRAGLSELPGRSSATASIGRQMAPRLFTPLSSHRPAEDTSQGDRSITTPRAAADECLGVSGGRPASYHELETRDGVIIGNPARIRRKVMVRVHARDSVFEWPLT